MRINIKQKAFVSLFLFAFFMFLLTACATTTTTNPENEQGDQLFHVSGQVKDMVNMPIANACITFTGGFTDAFSDQNGYFSKAGLSGTVTITVIKDGYTFQATTVNQTCDNLILTGEPQNIEYI